MSTLIVPCVGRKIMNGIPQYLNRHPNGKLLIERSIEGVFSDKYRRVLIVLLKEDTEHFDAESIIVQEVKGYPLEFVLLDQMTSGPAETVYQAIQKANVTEHEYYGAAEPPVRCGESHLSGLTEPPHFIY